MPQPRRTQLNESDYTVEDHGFVTPCWVVNTRKGNGRYALVRIDGRERYAHRAMYEQEVGPIPEGMELDHLCSVTRCICPEHLEPVTRATNARRGRGTRLTIEQARRAKHGGENARALAAEFGVSEFCIYRIRRGVDWADV
jgi:HNH endonuclease